MQNFLDFLLRGKYNWLIPDTKIYRNRGDSHMNPKQILKNVHCLLDWKQKITFFIYYADHDPVLRLNAAHSQGDRLADRRYSFPGSNSFFRNFTYPVFYSEKL